MTDEADTPPISRRTVMLTGFGALAAAALAACGRSGSSSSSAAQTPTTSGSQPATTATGASATTVTSVPATTLAPTPTCVDADDVTVAQTEGPYFKASSPQRTDIRGNAGGTRLTLTGTVVTTTCQPVAQALVDFWQADDGGTYDNSGFTFRGHQFTDAQGRYQLETVIPGLYPRRTRHIHVKVQAPGGKIMTTQLYFPGEARNASDGIYVKACEVTMTDLTAGANKATFGFVLRP